jgi:hypothetical protein
MAEISEHSKIDGRTKIGKRISVLFDALMTRLCNPADPNVVADVRALAELKVAAEDARLILLAGTDRNPDQIIRLGNLIARLEKRLGLDGPVMPQQESIDAYLARTAREATA